MSSCSNNKSGNQIQGPPGQNGQSAYLFVRYAKDQFGTAMISTPAVGWNYIALLQKTTPTIPDPSEFIGLWNEYIGSDGLNGLNGTNGTNGTDGTDGGTYVLVSSPNFETVPGSFPTVITFSSLNTADYAYQIGSRVRVSKDASNWMEGVVSGTTATDITITVDMSQGAGQTSQTWYFSIAGQPNAMPVGFINMWSGTVNVGVNFSVNGLGLGPITGWAMCNGNNGTPDLQGRFIAGLGIGDYNAIGNTGGAASVTLTKAQIPAHVHAITTEPDHIHSATLAAFEPPSSDVPNTVTPGDNNNPAVAVSFDTDGAGEHNHGGNTGNGAADGLAGEAHENRPPYYVLAYIMRIA
jgi:microcystin-dependent protein